MYLPQNLWRQILKNMSGRELAQVYSTNKTVRNLIKSNNVLYKRWQAARNLHHKATPNVYANLTRLRNALLVAPPAKRKNIQNNINLINRERARRRVRNMRKLLTPNALKRWNAR